MRFAVEVESWILQIYRNKIIQNFEYTHQILDGHNVEPSHTKNHNHVQIVISFAYFCLSWSFSFLI